LQQIRDLQHPVFSAKARASILELGFCARRISLPLIPTTKELIRSIDSKGSRSER
jgi:hypothetical protein